MEFAIDLSRLNMNPAWSGRTDEVYFMTDAFIEESYGNASDEHIRPFMGSRHWAQGNDGECRPLQYYKVSLGNYQHIATIDYKWVVAGHCNPPFAVCQNAFSSWHRLDGQETDTFTMKIVNEESKNGERSLSIGDVIRDVELDRYYVVDSTGYSRILPLSLIHI